MGFVVMDGYVNIDGILLEIWWFLEMLLLEQELIIGEMKMKKFYFFEVRKVFL